MNSPTENKPAVNVLINDKEYQIQGAGEAEFIQRVANYVDTRMSEISIEVPTEETEDLAILTALNIAHELFICRENKENENPENEGHNKEVGSIIQTIQELLDDEE